LLGKRKVKKEELKEKKEKLRIIRDKVRQEILEIKYLKILSEEEFRMLSLKYGEIFETGTGAESLREIYEKLDLKELAKELEKSVKKSFSSFKKREFLED